MPGGEYFNSNCIGTFALPDGRRATEKEFSYIGSFHEGLAKIAIKDKGYGFVDKDMNIVIEPKYKSATGFKNGVAVVKILDEDGNKKVMLIDKNGNERFFEKDYKRILYEHNGDFCNEGMFMVSDHEDIELAFYSDYENNAGVWGYADSNGKEIVKPQYIFAFDFEKGLALVCKGEWRKKWEDSRNTGQYWREKELWGMIDKTGREVVPFIFDEIKYYHHGSDKYLQAHYGGWHEGKWGIINFSGEWVVEPVFEDLGYEIYNDDYITFYNEDKWNSPDDDIPMGIYSIKEQRALFEPQFLDVKFIDNGTFIVEKYDDKSRRNKQIIIDINGKVLVDSQYDSIWKNYKKKDMCNVYIVDANGKCLSGLIDKNGKEIIPCKYDMAFDGILFDLEVFIYLENGKFGIRNFNGEIIIPPEYTYISDVMGNYFKVKVGRKKDFIDEGKIGIITLDGKTVIPIEYKDISIEEGLIMARDGTGTTLYKIVKK